MGDGSPLGGGVGTLLSREHDCRYRGLQTSWRPAPPPHPLPHFLQEGLTGFCNVPVHRLREPTGGSTARGGRKMTTHLMQLRDV